MNYRNFDIEFVGHSRTGGVESFRVRVIDSPGGSQKSGNAAQVSLPLDLRDRLDRLERRDLDAVEMVALGDDLANLMLPPPARRLLDDSLLTLRDDERLRLRLRLESPGLARIPWELTRIAGRDAPDGDFLALDNRVSLVRYEVMEQAAPRFTPLGPDASIRLGVLMSNPATVDYPALDLDVEERRIRDGTAQVANLEVRIERDGDLDALERLMADAPHMFHFAGHGEFVEEMAEEFGQVEGRGTLILVGHNGDTLRLPADRLSRNLRQRGIRLVVLSCCEGATRDSANAWSGIAPALVRAGIPAVVAMQFKIADESAIQFAEGFYQSLALARPVDAAVSDGRQAIANTAGESSRDWAAPVLYLSRGESVLFPVSRALSIRYYANVALLASALVVLLTWAWQHLLYMLPVARLTGMIAAGTFLLVGIVLMGRLLGPLVRRATSDALSRIEVLLERRAVSWGLSGCLGLLMAVYLGSSSVYLLYDADGPTDGRISVEVLDADGSLFADLSVGPDRGSAGRFTMFARRGTYRFNVIEPGWLKATDRLMHPLWPTVHVNTSEFVARDVVVLRILPAFGVMQVLPEPGDELPNSPVRLDLVIGGKVTTIPDIRRRSLLLGPDDGFVRDRLAEEDGETRNGLFRANLEGLRPRTIEGWVSRWNVNAVVTIVPALVAGDTVFLELRRADDTTAIAVDTIVAQGAAVGRIQNHFLDGG